MSARLLLRALMLIGVAAWSVRSEAGVVLIPGEFQEGKFQFPKAIPDGSQIPLPQDFSYRASLSRSDVTVDGHVVRVRSTETLKLSGRDTPLVGLIPLDPLAVLGSVKVTIGNTVADVETLDADAASTRIHELAKTLKSVTILSLSGQPLIVIPSVTFTPTLDISIEYSQPVKISQGVRFLNVPMSAVRWTGQPLERLMVGVSIRGKQPIRAILSPTHATSIDRPQLETATIKVKAHDVIDDQDFRLCWVEDADDLGLRLLTHQADGEDDGYFLLLGNPTGQAGNAIEKDVTFVLDTSGSMRGEKLEQCRAAVEYCLENLNTGDRFNIVTFGSTIESFQESVVASTEPNLNAARIFVEDLVANGRTNIDGALKQTALSQQKSARPQIAIFLTDGTPTAGELLDERILANFKTANQAGLRVFVMGVGNEVNAHLLDQLAEVSDGISEYVAPEEEIDQKIAGLYNRLANPVMTDVAVAFGDLQAHEVFPRKVPALFRNSQIMLFGRYRDEPLGTIEITGKLTDKNRRYATNVEAAGEVSCEFIAPLWASRKIGYLLQEIRLHGEEKELINEVVRLSKKYGIVTEYTQSLVLAGGVNTRSRGFRDEASLRLDAKQQFESARATKTGVWAVSQAKNDRYLQSRVVLSNAMNKYLDRRGQSVQAAATLMQIGGRAYYYRGGVWQDGAEAGTRKMRTIKAFSNEYFELLSNKDFAQAQQLGGPVSLNIGDERVVVESVPGAKVPVIPRRFNGQRNNRQQQQIGGSSFRGQRGFNQLQTPQQIGPQRINQIPNLPRIKQPQAKPQLSPKPKPKAEPRRGKD